MIKYNIVMCYYDKILVNVAAYGTPGKVTRLVNSLKMVY
jgi:hypothetical protein